MTPKEQPSIDDSKQEPMDRGDKEKYGIPMKEIWLILLIIQSSHKSKE
jgi:hypothetical protein